MPTPIAPRISLTQNARADRQAPQTGSSLQPPCGQAENVKVATQTARAQPLAQAHAAFL